MKVLWKVKRRAMKLLHFLWEVTTTSCYTYVLILLLEKLLWSSYYIMLYTCPHITTIRHYTGRWSVPRWTCCASSEKLLAEILHMSSSYYYMLPYMSSYYYYMPHMSSYQYYMVLDTSLDAPSATCSGLKKLLLRFKKLCLFGCALGARRLLEKSACFVVCAHPQASVSRAQPPRSIYVVL